MPPKRGTKRKVEEKEEEEEEKSVSSNSDSNDSDSDDSDDDDSNDDENDDDNDDNSEDGKKKGGRRVTGKKPPVKKPVAKVVKAATKKNGKKVTEKKTSASKVKKEKGLLDTEGKVARIKTLKKSERLEEARKAYKWWEAPKLPNGINWQYLEHPGMNFPPAYKRHNIPLKYDGQPVELTAEQEEVASFYAAMPEDGPQLGNPKTRPIFQRNFFEDFKEVLGPKHVIKSFSKCDFSEIKEYFILQKNLKKVATDEEKLVKKEEKEKFLTKFGYALIDGRLEKVIGL